MLRALIVMIALLPAAGFAETRPATGIFIKNNPLPATIPLQVRTIVGHDFFVALSDQESGEPVISGYIRGGDFFRLLVPPGDHVVTITVGQPADWQGPQTGFGANAEAVTLPLTFAITGRSRRQGHQITLRIQDGSLMMAAQQDQAICQFATWQDINHAALLRDLDLRLTTRSRFCG
jgi:hypothetical protein